MASWNPFEETATEDASPTLPTSCHSERSDSPPRSIEMIPMAMNPVTGHSYVQAPINTATSSPGIYPRLYIPGETAEPSAPLLPSSHLPRHQLCPTWSGASGGYHSLPRTHASSRLEIDTKPIRANRTKFDGDLFGIITDAASSYSPNANRVESHKERYNIRVDQARNELNSYFADLHQKLNHHHEKLLEGIDRRYRHNVSLIEKKEQEIHNLENTETVLLQNKGDSFEKLKDTLSEQKRNLETEIIPLTEMKLIYKPEQLDDVINKVVTIAPAPDASIGSRPRSRSENGNCPVEQCQERETTAPDSQINMNQSKLDTGNTTNSTTRLGPIRYNVGMGVLLDQVQDPAGIAIDKHQDNVIYVADKERHRIQVYDRSGRHLKSITKGEKMRHPHSLAVSNEFLFVLCAGKQEQRQCILKFDKKNGEFWNGIRLNDIRHTPISVFQENIYVPTSYTGIIEVFSVRLKSCRKIEITLEKRNSMSIFSSGPEVRDICVTVGGIYLLVSNSENWIQVFDTDGNITNTLAPLGCLNDAHHFTVDNRGTVLVTEGKEGKDGKIKIFKPGDKNIAAISNAEMGGEMERIASPRGIAVDSHGKVVLCCAQKEWLLKEC